MAGCLVGIFTLLAALLAIWRRDWSLPKRAGLFFVLVYVVAVFQMSTTGLTGSGRIGLLVFPSLALILVGHRAGWLVCGVSVTTFAVFTALRGAGIKVSQSGLERQSIDLTFWLVQGVLWLALLVPLMVLLSRFQTLQVRLMIEERQARRENEIAERERRRLEEATTQISKAEERRLGAELHDGLCQQLTAALLACTALENELLACELRASGATPALSAQATHHLYRIAQEAVQNALKHARCRRLILELSGSSAGLILRIMDDGRACAHCSPTTPGGMGTRSLPQRTWWWTSRLGRTVGWTW